MLPQPSATLKLNEKGKCIADAYKQIREEQELDYDPSLEELDGGRLLIGARALVFASRSKISGDKVVKYTNDGKSILKTLKQDMTTDERVELLQNARMKMFDTVIENRKQIGSLVGIAAASALTSERSTKQLTKLMRTSLRGK